VLARHVGDHVPPITLTTIRWFGVFLILLPFAWPHLARDWPVLRAHLPLSFLSATGLPSTTRFPTGRCNIPRR